MSADHAAVDHSKRSAVRALLDDTPEWHPLYRAALAVTPSQLRLIEVIDSLHEENAEWPTVAAIARDLGTNRTAASRRIHRLERIGVLLRAGGVVRVVQRPDGVVMTLAETRS